MMDASAHFKSSDGHSAQFHFSSKRLNLHLLDLLEQEGGLRSCAANSSSSPKLTN